MNIKSIGMSFRIEANFHALNNEGSGGTNVMEPRRITIGDKEYDGISGEIVRRHILENFVRLCSQDDLHQRCAGLVPDRGKEALKGWIEQTIPPSKKGGKGDEKFFFKAENYPNATTELISKCAICDVGGYLIPFSSDDKGKWANKEYSIDGTLKRDSCFEVGWLITEHPANVDYTQHSAYHETQEHNLFVQNIRSGIYAGVIRIDIDRIGHNDWWWLDGSNNPTRYVLTDENRLRRVKLLLEAIEQYLLSQSGAKQAGWLQHPSGFLEGMIVTSTSGPAPFVSPIKLDFSVGSPTIIPNPNYKQILQNLKVKKKTLEVHEFLSMDSFAEQMQALRDNNGEKEATTNT